MALIRKLNQTELPEINQGGEDLYPVTHTSAVYNDEGKSLSVILNELLKKSDLQATLDSKEYSSVDTLRVGEAITITSSNADKVTMNLRGWINKIVDNQNSCDVVKKSLSEKVNIESGDVSKTYIEYNTLEGTTRGYLGVHIGMLAQGIETLQNTKVPLIDNKGKDYIILAGEASNMKELPLNGHLRTLYNNIDNLQNNIGELFINVDGNSLPLKAFLEEAVYKDDLESLINSTIESGNIVGDTIFVKTSDGAPNLPLIEWANKITALENKVVELETTITKAVQAINKKYDTILSNFEQRLINLENK